MSTPRNVLQILSDQHLATCCGFEGHLHAITPHLDRLAAEGTTFRRAYTQNPICTPSRVSILSGQYCHNHGVYGLNGPAPQNLPSFLQHFRQQGYRCAAIGKIHPPDRPHNWLRDHCDLLADCYESDNHELLSPYRQYLRERGLEELEDSQHLREAPRNAHFMSLDGRPSLLPFEHSAEGWSVQTARRFMQQCHEDNQPFCIQVSFPRPHQTYTPAREFLEMYPDDVGLPEGLYNDCSHRPPHFREAVERFKEMQWVFEPRDWESGVRRMWKAYLACITHVDYAVGQLLQFLDANGLVNDTVVVYGSDHGAYSGTYGIAEKAPGICSEAVCRVPMVWRGPGVAAGKQSTLLVENIDMAPTFAALCGLPTMDTVDGKDISALLQGRSTPAREVAVTEHVWSKSLRWKQWRFVHYQREMFGSDEGELYNIETDPHETTNLYNDAEYSAVREQCRRLLLEWLIGTTRVLSILPGDKSLADYPTALDGKEANWAGACLRAQRKQWDYI